MRLMVLLVVVSATGFVSAPAQAADELGLSTDGKHFTPNLTTPLFDPSRRWVPGDKETASFWVRNQSSGGALLDVAVLGSNLDSLLETGDLDIRIAAADGSGTDTTEVGRQQLLTSRQVAAGQTERIDVTVEFDHASTNQSQFQELDLRFDVRLTQGAVAGELVSDSDGSDNSDSEDSDSDRSESGTLPGTGASARPGWLFIAGVMVGAGVALIRRSRREDAADV